MKKLSIKLLIILTLSLSITLNIIHAELIETFTFTNTYGSKILVIGETHDARSISQFKELLNKKIILGSEKDFTYLLELPSDLPDTVLTKSKGLLDYLRLNNILNSKKIDCDRQHTSLQLSFPFAEIFEQPLSIELMKKIEEFFTKLGTYTEKDFPAGILSDYVSTCKDLTKYQTTLNQAIKTHDRDKSLSIINDFRTKYKDTQRTVCLRLAVTPNGMQNRNQTLASNIAEYNQKNNAICIVGNLHLKALHDILKYQYNIKTISEIKDYEDIVKRDKQIFPSA
ncbi:MAG: hypothetical protein ABH827_00680 [bacterium]